MSMTREKALIIATKAHEGQYRMDGITPYITHPIAVAERALKISAYELFLYQDFYPKLKMEDAIYRIAILHDVLENTTITAEDLLAEGLSQTEIRVLQLLDKRTHKSYSAMIEAIAEDYLASLIKMSDLIHNLSTLDATKFKARHEKYSLALLALSLRCR